MRAIMRKRAQRMNDGKASAFRVRGKPVDLQDVVRYWARRGVSIEDITAWRNASATPPEVICLTPLISRSATPVSTSLVTPDALAVPERILTLIQSYLKGSFDSGSWMPGYPRNFCYSRKSIKGHESRPAHNTTVDSYDEQQIQTRTPALADMDMIEDCCLLACDLFSQQLFQEAGATLIHAAAAIKQIVLTEDPHTLIRLISIFRTCLFNDRFEIASIILRQFSSMGRLLLGDNHPWPEICHYLTTFDQGQFRDALKMCSRMITDSFATSLGRLHRSTLYVAGDYAFIVSYDDQPQACANLRLLLGECESSLGSSDNRTIEARRMLMDTAFVAGFKREAEYHAWILNACDLDIGDMKVSSWYRVFALRALAYCHYASGQVDSAILRMNEALALHGSHDSWARRWLLDLENWHLQQGDDRAAGESRNKRLVSLENSDGS